METIAARKIRSAEPSFREQHIKEKKKEDDYAATFFLSLECNVVGGEKKKHYFVV